MIEKERLEELIEKGATIYFAYENDYFEKKLKKGFSIGKTHLYSDFDVGYPLEQCFETKEDAEEYAEFGNITIIERLELPNWKEFLKQETAFMFKSKTSQIISLFKDDNTIYIEDENWNILRKSLTRENYNEARRLCVKLFKGER